GLVSAIRDKIGVTGIPRRQIGACHSFVGHVRARHLLAGLGLADEDLLVGDPGGPEFYLTAAGGKMRGAVDHALTRGGDAHGPVRMTDWGPTNTGCVRSAQEHKRAALRRLRPEFPVIRWILIGDDGQHDPMIYREFAAEFPDHVAAIAIRELSPTEQ